MRVSADREAAAAVAVGGYRQLLQLKCLKFELAPAEVSYSGSGHIAVRVHTQAASNVSDTGSRPKSLCPHTQGRICSYASFSLPGSVLLLQISRSKFRSAQRELSKSASLIQSINYNRRNESF